MKGKEVKKYIMRDLGFIPRHDCEALAAAITDMAEEISMDIAMRLLDKLNKIRDKKRY